MADETAINGLDHQTAPDESFYDQDRTEELTLKVESLELEKRKLLSENDEAREKLHRAGIEIEKMTGELRSLESEIERLRDSDKMAAIIAARAAGLETDVSRLQHDLVQAMSDSAEANSEVEGLRRALGEKEARIKALEREVGEKAQAEEKAREVIGEKEKEIGAFKKTVEGLESKLVTLEKEIEKEIKAKVAEAVNGAADAVKEVFEGDGEPDSRWPVVALAGGAVVVGVGLLCVVYAKRR